MLMKDHIISSYLIIIVTIGLMISSCSQEKAADKTDQEASADGSDLYYCKNYHCFDFVKQCELEMLKLVKFDILIYVASSQFPL